MHRALRSMPSLLKRQPPPLVIEARDARLPLTSINPAFERVLQKTAAAQASMRKGKGKAKDQEDYGRGSGDGDWSKRRLVVYTKRDLVDKELQEPLRNALRKYGSTYDVLYVDTRDDKDVRKVLQWVHSRARTLHASEPRPANGTLSRIARSRLSGAFRHTPTPEEGVRLVILGMPNVGKSSLLNALRRVGTGKGKAVSTAPEPGHTRKLTGTVRITPDLPSSTARSRPFLLDRNAQEPSNSASPQQDAPPPVYVYDTPGVMVPFLGRGVDGAERGLKLAVTAGIKSSLFDSQVLADYLLYRLNLRYLYDLRHHRANARSESIPPPQPLYLTHLPLDRASARPTNAIVPFLTAVAARAPGTLGKGGVPDLDGAARFFIDRWRDGKVGQVELDLGLKEASRDGDGRDAGIPQTVQQQVDDAVKRHFDRVEQAEEELDDAGGAAAQHAQEDSAGASALQRLKPRGFKANAFVFGQRTKALPSLVSKNQVRKRNKAEVLRERKDKFELRRGAASSRTRSADRG